VPLGSGDIAEPLLEEPGGVRDASRPWLRRQRLRKRMTWGRGCWKDDEENGEIWWHGYR